MTGLRVDTPLTRELARQRLRRDWMAERLGVREWTFTRVEKGEQRAPEGWYERAAEILGVTVDSIRRETEMAA